MQASATQPLLQTDGVCIVRPEIAELLQAVDALQARHLKVRLSAVIQPDLIFSKTGKSVAFLIAQGENLRTRSTPGLALEPLLCLTFLHISLAAQAGQSEQELPAWLSFVSQSCCHCWCAGHGVQARELVLALQGDPVMQLSSEADIACSLKVKFLPVAMLSSACETIVAVAHSVTDACDQHKELVHV